MTLKVHLNHLLGNTGEVLVLVTSVQQEAEDQDLSGCTVQKASDHARPRRGRDVIPAGGRWQGLMAAQGLPGHWSIGSK